MKQKSMTALVSAFSRAYHSENNDIKIFNDSVARLLLSEQEYSQIEKSMAQGIQFFNPGFSGSDVDALRWIVDNQLSPSPLGRSAYAEQALRNAVNFGAKQYLIFAAGYDSFAYRQPGWASQLHIFELDHPLMSMEKQKRINSIYEKKPDNLTYLPVDLALTAIDEYLFDHTEFDRSKLSFCSLLGISYYLSKENFTNLIRGISNTVCTGSTIVFDYPDQDTYTGKAGERVKKQAMMAGNAGEAMLASYSNFDMEALLSNCGFLIHEHLEPKEITKQYFAEYNQANPQHIMSAFDNVNYCLAVKK
ncbi:SAM-dependent methyltransferase [Anaerocolumna sedimenticola]|uniref:S-adenosyl-L-methionine-dependent methyltransferase n=1 Tax=Anaerocolumna sedimenticola TaxID=2696063 RepID=A0A6P1TR32_9FIRM|nr:class I SAM-dependent methyltransferase [Anaerocolumna sedimenticola]QHQ63394.1 SAM-dependent methyltransferase [Anaerocolumna sedimenticola]